MSFYFFQEDEVDGIDPIIRVWNLDKVFVFLWPLSHNIITEQNVTTFPSSGYKEIQFASLFRQAVARM